MGLDTKAELTITGEQLDCDIIARVTGVQPDRCWQEGDKIGKSTLERKMDGCVLCKASSSSIDIPALVNTVLCPVEEQRSEFIQMCNSRGWDVEVACVAYVAEQAPVLCFPADLVQRVASLGASLDVDIILTEC